MGSIFSYESTPMQILMFLGDLMILNFLFILACIPIFTIGAAQAGLYTGLRVLMDKEDDSSPSGAFFRGFATGFGKVTIAWGIATLVLVAVALAGYVAIYNGAPVWVIAIGVCVCALFQSLVSAFHARFDCTPMQLLRNTWFLVIAHPLRSIGIALLIWLPVIVLLYDAYPFMMGTPIWGTLYYSTAFLFANTFLKKPFQTLIDNFNEVNGIVTEQPQEETEEEEDEDPYESGRFFTMPLEEPAPTPAQAAEEASTGEAAEEAAEAPVQDVPAEEVPAGEQP